MSPRRITDPLVRDTPVLDGSDSVGVALETLLTSDLPAVPVVDHDTRLLGIFGEREFIAALFPAYLGQLRHAGFVSRSLEDALQKRAGCVSEPLRAHLNTEHVSVNTDFSDAQVAESFLHHRVLVLPVLEHRRVLGVITRADFFEALALRVLGRG